MMIDSRSFSLTRLTSDVIDDGAGCCLVVGPRVVGGHLDQAVAWIFISSIAGVAWCDIDDMFT